MRIKKFLHPSWTAPPPARRQQHADAAATYQFTIVNPGRHPQRTAQAALSPLRPLDLRVLSVHISRARKASQLASTTNHAALPAAPAQPAQCHCPAAWAKAPTCAGSIGKPRTARIAVLPA